MSIHYNLEETRAVLEQGCDQAEAEARQRGIDKQPIVAMQLAFHRAAIPLKLEMLNQINKGAGDFTVCNMLGIACFGLLPTTESGSDWPIDAFIRGLARANGEAAAIRINTRPASEPGGHA